MKKIAFIITFIYLCKIKSSTTTSDNPDLDFEYLYNEGVEYYLSDKWDLCVKHFELAIEDWHWWTDKISQCRGNCSKDAEDAQLLSNNLDYSAITFEQLIHNTLCLVQCKKNIFGKDRMDKFPSADILYEFDIRKPYDYLQLCYFKMARFEDAANAALTVLAIQPEHQIMKDNIEYYIKQGSINPEDVVNLELKDYAAKYYLADQYYERGDYEKTIELMEEVLQLYWKEYNKCRSLCETPFDQGWFPDFVASIANHFTFALRCKIKCPDKITNFYGTIVKDFLPSVLNYLQFSYHQLSKNEKAAEAVESYLILDPEDPVQLKNKQFYLSLDGVSEEYFTPRKNVVEYKNKIDYEQKLLDFIDTKFISFNERLELEKFKEFKYTKRNHDSLNRKGPAINDDKPQSKSRTLNEHKNVSQMKFPTTFSEDQLNGTKRAVVDEFISEMECEILRMLIEVSGEEGNGYREKTSPHTEYERFEGVTLARLALMAHGQLLKADTVNLILDVTNEIRENIENYFNLTAPLYFSFTHLVCRSSIEEKSANRNLEDLSHEVHADNCVLQDSGDCLKIPPAYTFRDYSAILYLNEDFEGGEFIFTKDKTGIKYESKIKPKCGRMLMFSAGKENAHGVRPVMRGNRCAVALWFTLQEKYKEVERTLVEQLLKKMEKKKNITKN